MISHTAVVSQMVHLVPMDVICGPLPRLLLERPMELTVAAKSGIAVTKALTSENFSAPWSPTEKSARGSTHTGHAFCPVLRQRVNLDDL